MSPEDLVQGTQEWRDARAGCVTASCVDNLFTKARKEGTGVRAEYRAKLICELLTGKTQDDTFQSWQIRQGHEREPDARSMYELSIDEELSTAGFIQHASISRYGASPDAIVGMRGLAQFKCPTRAVHLNWLLAGVVPSEHQKQMYSEMDCCQREWNDFCSYNPDFPENMQLFKCRLLRDETQIELIRVEVIKFNQEIDVILERVKSGGDLESVIRKSVAKLKGE